MSKNKKLDPDNLFDHVDTRKLQKYMSEVVKRFLQTAEGLEDDHPLVSECNCRYCSSESKSDIHLIKGLQLFQLEDSTIVIEFLKDVENRVPYLSLKISPHKAMLLAEALSNLAQESLEENGTKEYVN